MTKRAASLAMVVVLPTPVEPTNATIPPSFNMLSPMTFTRRASIPSAFVQWVSKSPTAGNLSVMAPQIARDKPNLARRLYSAAFTEGRPAISFHDN